MLETLQQWLEAQKSLGQQTFSALVLLNDIYREFGGFWGSKANNRSNEVTISDT